MTITIIMTTYNGINFIEDCINSVLNQTYKNFKFIIVDDLSSDGTFEYLQSLDDNRISLFQNKHNQGQAKSLNFALNLVTTNYVCRLDQDDICFPERLEEQLLYLSKYPNLDLICSNEILINEYGKYFSKTKLSYNSPYDYVQRLIFGLIPIFHTSSVYKYESIKKTKFYNSQFSPAEDFELWTRFALYRMEVNVINKNLVYRRIHRNQQSFTSKQKQINNTKIALVNLFDHFNLKNKENLEIYLNFIFFDYDFNKFNNKDILIFIETFNNIKKKLVSHFNYNLKSIMYFNFLIIKRIGLFIYFPSIFKFFKNNKIGKILFLILSPMYIKSIKKSVKYFFK